MIRQITIILIPLIKGENTEVGNDIFECRNQSRKLITIQIECIVNNTTTFDDLITQVISHVKIYPYFEHLQYIRKAITIHFNYSYNCSHGPYNLLDMEYYLNKKIIDETTSEYCYSKQFKNIFYILYPTDVSEPFDLKFDIIPFKTPIIWLDVDGVINILRRSTKDDFFIQDVKKASILHGFGFARMNKILYSPTIIERINKWSNIAEVRFMSSWGNMATYRLAPSVGLLPFGHNCIGKYELMERIPSKEDLDRPIVWIDDDINSKYTHISKSLIHLKSHFKNKVLIVDTSNNENSDYVGLTEKQADLIDEFLINYSSIQQLGGGVSLL